MVNDATAEAASQRILIVHTPSPEMDAVGCLDHYALQVPSWQVLMATTFWWCQLAATVEAQEAWIRKAPGP